MLDESELRTLDMNEPIGTQGMGGMQDNRPNTHDVNSTEGRMAHIGKNINRREAMIEYIFEEGTPSDPRAMRLANELLNASDDALLRLEKIGKEAEKSNQDDASLKLELATMLRESFKLNQQLAKDRAPVDTNIPDEVYDGEILETSLSLERRPLDVNKYMGEDDA